MSSRAHRCLPMGWLSERQVSQRLSLSKKQIQDLVHEKVIPFHQPGPDGWLVFRVSEIEGWLNIENQYYGH